MASKETTPLLGTKAKGSQETGFWDSSMGIFDSSSQKNNVNYWRKQKSMNFVILAAAALIGVLLAVIVNETLWYSAVGFETMETGFTTLLKVLVFASTVIAYIYLYLYYDALVNVKRCEGVELSYGFGIMSLWESKNLLMFLLDALILLPQPFPFVHFSIEVQDIFRDEAPIVYTSENIFMALMFIRIVFLPRLIAELFLMSREMAIVVARLNNVEIDTWFVIRSLFVANFGTLMVLISVMTVSTSYIMLLCERPYPHADELSEFGPCLYQTIITMTTVGYGDLVPHTRLGRGVAVINGCAGVVFISLIIQGVVQRVALNAPEAKVMQFIELNENARDVRNKAAVVVQTVYRQYRLNVEAAEAGRANVKVKVHPKIRNVLTEFRFVNREKKRLSAFKAESQIQFEQIESRLSSMESQLSMILEKLNK